jgi:hypothetical protein
MDALQGKRGSHDVLAQSLARGLVEDAGSVFDSEKAYRLRPAQDLPESGLQVDDASFEITMRFAVTTGGLLFRFSQGEIGPHALGAADIFLSYRDPAPLIRDNGALGPALADGRLP